MNADDCSTLDSVMAGSRRSAGCQAAISCRLLRWINVPAPITRAKSGYVSQHWNEGTVWAVDGKPEIDALMLVEQQRLRIERCVERGFSGAVSNERSDEAYRYIFDV